MDVSSANEETPAPKSQGPADDKFDETIYTVVSTGKTSETNDTDDLFQTSFATLLDGSEFMSGIFEKNDNDMVEEYRMDAAIHKGMKMALRCSCPLVGSYKPFDATDPKIWNKKRSKSPRRHQNNSPSGKQKENHASNSTSPMVTSCVLEQQEAVSRRSGEGEHENREKYTWTQLSPSNLLVPTELSECWACEV